MKFSDFVSDKSIQDDLKSDDKEGVIRELVDTLVAAGEIKTNNRNKIVREIINREKLGTTAIGGGRAVPHAKHPAVRRTSGAVGLSRGGVDFESLDGAPVKVFFLIVSPPDRSQMHLQTLEKITYHLREENFCSFLAQAQSAADIQLVLREADGEQ